MYSWGRIYTELASSSHPPDKLETVNRNEWLVISSGGGEARSPVNRQDPIKLISPWPGNHAHHLPNVRIDSWGLHSPRRICTEDVGMSSHWLEARTTETKDTSGLDGRTCTRGSCTEVQTDNAAFPAGPKTTQRFRRSEAVQASAAFRPTLKIRIDSIDWIVTFRYMPHIYPTPSRLRSRWISEVRSVPVLLDTTHI